MGRWVGWVGCLGGGGGGVARSDKIQEVLVVREGGDGKVGPGQTSFVAP